MKKFNERVKNMPAGKTWSITVMNTIVSIRRDITVDRYCDTVEVWHVEKNHKVVSSHYEHWKAIKAANDIVAIESGANWIYYSWIA